MKEKMFTSWSLVWLLACVLLAAAGALNLSQRAFQNLPPTDGVRWTQTAEGIFADKVTPGLAGSRAGISVGDRLIGIGFESEKTEEITSAADVQMYLESVGVDGSLTYFYQKPSYSFANNFFYADLRHIDSVPRWTPSIIFLSIVGIVWLGVGIFVLFKQGSRSPFVLHFAAVCLAAFVFHTFRSIGIGRDFDLAVDLLDNIALAFFAPLFLHFCIRYPVTSSVFTEQRWKTFILYAPAAVFSVVLMFVSLVPQLVPEFGLTAAIARLSDKFNIFGILYQANFYHFVLGVSTGAGVLVWRVFRSRQPVVRQRLKWTMWGTLAAITPIVLMRLTELLAIPIPDDNFSAAITTLPLALIPISFGHSVVRYRLMDVDVVVRRALVYAMTTVAIAMMIGAVALGLVFLAVGSNLSNPEIALRALIAIVAMGAIVMLSEPLKKFLQERADRFFYGERYDMRQGLLDFGKTLSATTALDPLLDGLTERLRQVLDVEKVAVFLEEETEYEHYRLAKSVGLSSNYKMPADFRTMIRQKSAAGGVVRADEFEAAEVERNDVEFNGNGNGNGYGHRRTVVRQELHYYVPCVAGGKMAAVIGLGRAKDGSLLSSEDLEILRTVSGYIAVAIENSRLYGQQKEHTEEMALLKEFNESIVESVNVGLLAVDESGRITRCNSPFEQMMGLSREQVVGQLVEDVFDESFALNLETILGKSRWHLTEIRNAYKLHTYDKAGRSLIINVAVAPLRSISNQQTGAIIVLENVSSRVKLEETLQQSEKLSSIGLLAAGVAHEVNTPLTGVSSYTQMLLGMIPETDPKHALLQKMQRQTDRASNIVGNLLNFSRTGSAEEFGEIGINKLLNDTLQLLEPQLRKSSIEIVKDYSDDVPPIEGSAGKLQQVFTNLILNARDAMFDGGTITLRTAADGVDGTVIEVSDTGEGIPAENLKKVFDPFFTTKGVGNGTGLGLAVSYGIVQEHAGTIEVQSSEGEGATFRLVFPAARRPDLQRAVS
ncbi:MAG TPA: ATP-binding protein [Pyrinomonadaceae bacterium]|nr:ATP-binding protein [Pyrinomonadaceae bacterium]